jgi:crotonobetainyl-CoA:carnitine CoA-transferase CaiB-like acyl-CoA transferase
VPCSPINNIPELAETEQLRAAGLLRTLPGSDASKLGAPNEEVFAGSRAVSAE